MQLDPDAANRGEASEEGFLGTFRGDNASTRAGDRMELTLDDVMHEEQVAFLTNTKMMHKDDAES